MCESVCRWRKIERRETERDRERRRESGREMVCWALDSVSVVLRSVMLVIWG